MKASINSLGQVLYAPSQYVIPVFQRNYRWERPQWDRLWSSLVDLQQPDKTGNHFMGFLVFVQGGVVLPGQNPRFHLIDGQQRLTTASILLASIRNVARRLEDSDLANEVDQFYLFHPLRKGEHRFRLLPKATDAAAFIAIVEGREPAAGRMADALTYFDEAISNAAAADGDAPRRMFNTVCQRLEFMCATLESENAYNIFKSLNSTGVPLGQADLIRNFVFMHVHPDRQDEFEKEHWTPLEAMFSGADGRLDEQRFSRFFRDVLMAGGQYVQPAQTFTTFEAKHDATGFDPFAVTRSLTTQAGNYVVIVGDRADTSPQVTASIADLNMLDSSTTYPLLLRLFECRDLGQLRPQQLAHAVRMVRDFIFRRLVCGDSSRGYGQMFVRAPVGNTETPVEVLREYLLARGWPHDARFAEAFVLFPFYKSGYAREALVVLERARGHKEPASLRLAQVEHVMPQTLSRSWVEALGDDADRIHEEWLHRVGNLTLTAYNQELGNQPFEMKRIRFADSNIGLTRDVGEQAFWTESEIQDRGQRLAAEAVRIWEGPAEPHASEDVAVQLQESRAVRSEFWTAFREHLTARHPDVPPLEPSYKRSIRLRTGVRHVSMEVRYKVQEDAVAVDIFFHRQALSFWQKLKNVPQALDAMIGEAWLFEQAPKAPYAWATVSRGASSSDPAHWPSLHAWLGQKLSQTHELVLPYLRSELGASPVSAVVASEDDNEAVERESAVTDVRQRQRRFWGFVGDAIRERSASLRPQKPLAQHWTNLSVGRTGFFITLTAKNRDDRVGVEFFISTGNAKQQFRALQLHRADIDAALGFPVEWDELPDRISSRIGCWRDDSSLADETMWPEYAAWIADRAVRMEAVLRPLVRELPSNHAESE